MTWQRLQSLLCKLWKLQCITKIEECNEIGNNLNQIFTTIILDLCNHVVFGLFILKLSLLLQMLIIPGNGILQKEYKWSLFKANDKF